MADDEQRDQAESADVTVQVTSCADSEAVNDDRTCRFCFEGPEAGELLAPCCCTGTIRWVHSHCLKRWQRGLVASLSARSENAPPESRQRICNVCGSAFNIAPPTQMELLESFASPELAKLIVEGSLVGSHRDFSGVLRREVAALPMVLRDSIGHRHWIHGLFLVVRVAAAHQRSVLLRIEDEDDLNHFAQRLEDGWAFEMRGRRMRVAREGPLAGAFADEACSAESGRRAITALAAPVTLTLCCAAGDLDEGEDGVAAVNLTRPIELRRPADAYKCMMFAAALQDALARGAATGTGRQEHRLLAEVQHFAGGPYDEDEVACCVVTGGVDSETAPAVVRHGLLGGLREAQARARRCLGVGEEEGVASPGVARCRASGHELHHATCAELVNSGDPSYRGGWYCDGCGACAAYSEEPFRHCSICVLDFCEICNRRRSARTKYTQDDGITQQESDEPAAKRLRSEDDQIQQPVRLLVFWGSAVWSRRQLLVEIAKGSWGLCPAGPSDIAPSDPERIWVDAYPRLQFAPPSELTVDYSRTGSSGEAENGSTDNMATRQLRWAAMRQLLARQHLSLQRRTLILRRALEAYGREVSGSDVPDVGNQPDDVTISLATVDEHQEAAVGPVPPVLSSAGRAFDDETTPDALEEAEILRQ